jgi:hypothetical protein
VTHGDARLQLDFAADFKAGVILEEIYADSST